MGIRYKGGQKEEEAGQGGRGGKDERRKIEKRGDGGYREGAGLMKGDGGCWGVDGREAERRRGGGSGKK